jgi:hypothetical protein
LKKNLSSNKKDDSRDYSDLDKLDPKNPEHKKKILEQFKKYEHDQLEEKKNQLKADLPGCVRFYDECKYEGTPILTLCGNSYDIPKLAVEAENPSMKRIKSFKIAKEITLTIDYTYGVFSQKPRKFMESIECLPDLINEEMKKLEINEPFEIKILKVEDIYP